MSTISRRLAQSRRRLRAEHGLALPLVLLLVLVLAVLVLGLTQMTTSEVEIQSLTYGDVRAQYLAQAGMEHQIYLLKANKSAGALAPINYPATPGQEYWYSTTLTCLLNCSGNPSVRRWNIISTGEVRKSGMAQVLQTRAVRAYVDIGYTGSAFQSPTRVIIRRWEEVYP